MARRLHPLLCNIIYLCMVVAMRLSGNVFSLLFGAEYTFEEYYGFTIATQVLFIGLPAFCVLRAKRMVVPIYERQPRPAQLALLVPLVACGLVLASLFALLMALLVVWAGGTPMSFTSPMPESDNAMQTILLFVATGFFAALCEETAFRGMFFAAYMPYGRLFAAILSGVFFALMHGSPLGLPGHMVLGIVLGLLMYWTGSIWVPMIYHLLHNTASLFIYMLPNGAQVGASPLGDALDVRMLPFVIIAIMLALVVYLALLSGMYALSRKDMPPKGVYPARLNMRPAWMAPLAMALVPLLERYARALVNMFSGA